MHSVTSNIAVHQLNDAITLRRQARITSHHKKYLLLAIEMGGYTVAHALSPTIRQIAFTKRDFIPSN